MRKFYLFIFFLFILLLPSENFGQNEVSNTSLTKTFLWNYELPAKDNNGPMDVSISGNYYFIREIIGSTIRVNLHYEIYKMSFMPKYGDLRYKYKGKIYKMKEVAGTDGQDPKIGWDDLNITGYDISIKAIGVKNERWFNLNVNYESVVGIGEVERDKDLNSLSLNLVASYATNIYYSNQFGLETRLDKMMRLQENREEYKKYIADGNNDFNNNNLENAKTAYQKALKLFPNESYPQSQIAKIDAQIKTETTKKLAAETAAENTKSVSKTSPSYNSSSGNSSHSNSSSTNSNTSNAKMANQSSEGSGQLSDKVKLSNGESVQVFRQGGKNYIQYADGKTVETNQTNFDAIQNTANKNAAQKAEYESKANAARELQIALNKANEEEHKARQAAKQAKAELTTQVVTQAVGLVGEILGDIAENARRKEAYLAQQREEQVERDRIAEENRQKKIKKIALHTNYITTVKDAKLPLSSDELNEETIYYFAFNVDKTALATTTPTINLTGIFPIAKYNDGTWPYTANIKKELSIVLKNTDVVLNGYYNNRTEAEADFAIFKESLEKLNFTINSFEYKGKTKEVNSKNDDIWNDTDNKKNIKSTVTNEDFWEESTKEIKNKTSAPTKKVPTKKEAPKTTAEDFWNN